MTIRNKLNLNASLILIFVSTILIANVISSRLFDREYEHLRVLHGIHQSVSELDILTYEYVFHHQERMEVQWELKYMVLTAMLEQTFSGYTFDDIKSKSIFDSIRSESKIIKQLFVKLQENHKKIKSKKRGDLSLQELTAARNLEERLGARLFISSQSIIANSSTLKDSALSNIMRIKRRAIVITISVLVILLLMIVALSFMLIKSITIPLDILKKATDAVGKGNLDHAVIINSKDEIGDLAGSFNNMTENLKMVTASRDELQDEIKKRELLEEELREALLRAEQANRIKSEFLANMSHEIRTPLNAVTGYSELLTSIVQDEKQKSYLQSIKTAGKGLLVLINDILDLSKMEAGMLEVNYRPVNLHSLFQEIAEIFSMKIEGKGLEFQFSLDDKIPLSLIFDEIRLRQILLNIIGNAVKFTNTGYIKLSANQVAKEKNYEYIDLIISIEDTGIGIPEEDQENIFESFKQQSGQDNRIYGGTGLGLAISSKLIAIMNGKITVKSRVGKGSIFTITFEDIAVASVDVYKERRQKVEYNRMRFNNDTVIIVDDIVSNREFLREVLLGVNLKVLEAGNGMECLDLVRKENPAMILMDIRMPVMDGYKTIKNLKENSKTADIPVIAITASVQNLTRDKSRKKGFSDFLPKPINIRDLFTVLIKFLSYSYIEKEIPGDIPIVELKNICFEKEEHVDSSELDSILKEKILPLLEEMKGSVKFSSIKDLGDELVNLGEKHRSEALKCYGQSLGKMVTAYDLPGIHKNVNELLEIITCTEKDSEKNA